MKISIKQGLAGMVSISLLVTPMAMQAAWMDDFYTASGAAANVTHTQAINAQGIAGVSGGGVTWRVPNKSLQPLAISPPGFKAGCGGIDAWLGSYSFVNKDAYVQALRNFGQAAVGYFFKLALKSMAPEVEATLADIDAMAQKINGINLNSCQAAQKLVGGAFTEFEQSKLYQSINGARADGTATDQADSGNRSMIGGMRQAFDDQYKSFFGGGSSKSTVTTAQVKTKTPVEGNILRWMMNNSDVTYSEAEKDIVMSLIGPSWIMGLQDDGSGDDGVLINSGMQATLSFHDLVGDPASATQTYEILTCASSGDAQCTSLTKVSSDYPSFSRRALETMSKIQVGIQSGTPATLTDLDKSVLRLTSLPLYRTAALSASPGVGGAVAQSLQYDLAEYAGYEAASQLVESFLRTMKKVTQATENKPVDKNIIQQAKEVGPRLNQIRIEMASARDELYKRNGDPYAKLDLLNKVERSMYAHLNQSLAANSKFNHY